MDEVPVERLLTPKTTAFVLACSERQVYRLLTTGRLPAVHIGRSIRVQAQAVQAFIEKGGSR